MDEAGLVREYGELRPATGPEFGHGAADVRLRGSRADDHGGGDLVVAEPVRDLGHDLAFAVGENLQPAGGLCVRRSRNKLADQCTGSTRCSRSSPTARRWGSWLRRSSVRSRSSPRC
jgi:hypothetical protein